MAENIPKIKNLNIKDLVKSGDSDSYTIIRGGHDLGVFIRLGQTYFFRDNQNNTWVCQCTNINTGATNIEDAVKFMSY